MPAIQKVVKGASGNALGIYSRTAFVPTIRKDFGIEPSGFIYASGNPVGRRDATGLEDEDGDGAPEPSTSAPDYRFPGTYPIHDYDHSIPPGGLNDIINHGCIGLCAYRIHDPNSANLYPDLPNPSDRGGPQWSQGVHCFPTLKEAMAVQCNDGTKVIFAVQTSSKGGYGIGIFNYMTYTPIGNWEDMIVGGNGKDSGKVVVRAPGHFPTSYLGYPLDQITYCVKCIPKLPPPQCHGP
jgi:hypothetical protein